MAVSASSVENKEERLQRAHNDTANPIFLDNINPLSRFKFEGYVNFTQVLLHSCWTLSRTALVHYIAAVFYIENYGEIIYTEIWLKWSKQEQRISKTGTHGIFFYFY